jgi:glyoxylase-like metal-dependent hydrolase (beta-lactamase superfamily II)/rhodanese-related sulfurtransferase
MMNEAMRFEQLNPHSCKTYVIGDSSSKEVIIIDPVLDHFIDYQKLLELHDLTLVTVIDTHTHADHISSASSLRDITGCDYMMHKKAPAGCISDRVWEGVKFKIGKIPVKIIETPGHTEDSISLILPDRIFTGDALFLDDGGAGRDDLPGGDAEKHWKTLRRFKELPENLVVFPAHDYRNRTPSSLAEQKLSNPHLIDRSKEEFIHYIEDLRLGPAEWMKDVLKANYSCARDPNAAWIPADHSACELKGTLAHGVNDLVVDEVLPEKLKSILDSNTRPLILDVREPKELSGKWGRLEGILNIPIEELIGKLSELDAYKNKQVVTVCRSGARAYTAGQILKQSGFSNVSVLKGGMKAWRSKIGKIDS